MTHVNAEDNETFDSLLRRFNKRVQQDGILSEIKRREYFEKPSIKRKKKAAAKRRKSIRGSTGFRSPKPQAGVAGGPRGTGR